MMNDSATDAAGSAGTQAPEDAVAPTGTASTPARDDGASQSHAADLDSAPVRATGLEDYGYWLRWQQELPPRPAGGGKPFRRGLIWR